MEFEGGMVLRFISHIRYCLICALLFVFVAVSGLAVFNKNKPWGFRILCVPRMQASMQQDAQRELVNLMETNKNASSMEVYEHIKLTHPQVAGVQISTAYSPKIQTIITLFQEKPYIIINDSLIITDQEHTVPINAYPEALQENGIHVQSKSTDEKDLHDLYNFIKSLPSEILDNYAITWHDKTSIELHHQLLRLFVVRALSSTQFNESLLKALNAVVSYGEKIRELAKNKNAQWVVDVRCKNQIILARQKGGKLI